MKDVLQQAFREAFASSGLTHREFKERHRQDAAYLVGDSRASSDKLAQALASLGMSVEVRVFDPEQPVRPAFVSVDDSAWEI